MGKLFTLTWVLSAFWCVSWAQNSAEGFSQELLEIDRELRALQSAGGSGLEVERFQKEAIRDRWEQLVSLRMQLRSLDPDGQPISSKVDYLLVVARSNEMLFEFQSSRPWTRDPLFYLDAIRVLPYQSLTGDTEALERLEADLRRVPAWLELARENLVEASGQLADMALFHLENYDGVGQGEPFRNPPPAGILGWYQDLAQRAGESSAPLAEAARRALQELEALRDWLSQHRGFMIEPAHLGWSRYQWFVRNVRLMPFSVGQISTLGQREFARARAQL